jgi:hypothetical protein
VFYLKDTLIVLQGEVLTGVCVWGGGGGMCAAVVSALRGPLHETPRCTA